MSPKRRRRLAQKAMRNSVLLRKPVRGGAAVDDGSALAAQANALIAGALSQFLHSRRLSSRRRSKSRRR